MKKQSIKSHLKPYSIFQRRKTTINHAFASAFAPNDDYNEQILNSALELLGQNPDDDLVCVYCGNMGETWDHLVGLVKGAELRGYGHQIGNLVPCCKNCNSRKGSRDWQLFVEEETRDEESRSNLKNLLQSYVEQFAQPIDIDAMKREMPEEYANYLSIKEQIFVMMKEADVLAQKMREKIKSHKQPCRLG